VPLCVALLRGINVGKAKRLPMADLRALLEGLGHTEVRSLLNSGNAVFQSANRRAPATLAREIAVAIRDRLALEVPVVVKTAAQWQAIVSANPDPQPPDPSRLLVVLTQDAQALGALEALRPLLAADETFSLSPEAAYLHCASGILESRAATALLGKLGQGLTTRNWATVMKLQAMVQSP